MYIKRKIEDTILKYLPEKEIIALVGPRQCGKTTLLRHIYETVREDAVFITFEDIETLTLFEKDIKSFIKTYGKYKYIFIDEFQYAHNGGKLLKFWYDTNPTKIIVSGSSVIDLTVKAIKFLVGRVFVFELYPLDFEEFLRFKNSDLINLYLEKKINFDSPDLGGRRLYISPPIANYLKDLYEEFVIFGGYPQVVLQKGEVEKKNVLSQLYNTFFLREVKDILGIIDDFKLAKLIQSIALQVGSLVQYRELCSISELSDYKVKQNLNFLAKTFICLPVRPFFTNRRSQIVKNPKIFFYDTGLRNHAVDDFRPLEKRTDSGALLENAVAGQLIKLRRPYSFWRTKEKQEVDFVVELSAQKKIALEVKQTLRPNADQEKSIKEFRRQYPQIPLWHIYFTNISNETQNSFPQYLL